MGNNVGADLHRGQRIPSIENLKQIPYIEAQSGKRKRSMIFHSAAWKRLVESTRRRSSKGTKINPSLSYPDGGLYQSQNLRHVNGFPAGHENVKKSQSLYVINTKALSNGVIDTKPVLQQPRLAESQRNDGHQRNTQELSKQTAVVQSRISSANTNDRIGLHHDASVKPSTATTSLHEGAQSKTVEALEKTDTARNTVVTANNRKATVQSSTKSGAPRKVVIQASTSELLRCLGEFICRRCHRVPDFNPSEVGVWLRGVDHSLLVQGWQDITFIMPSSVVFVYLLCREMLPESITSAYEIKCIVLTCLYMSYSYMGNEISYPLRPFLIEPERFAFWSRCCRIMDKLSGKMLRINNDAQFFTTVFRDLKAYSTASTVPAHTNYIRSHPPIITNNARAIAVGGASW
ncbi:unnamed protein product [Clavelina lepadiformis]|uniref:Cyclin-dependent kinase 5 activator n=1 Tax=Clavelina lepadiformis TaxID=159417 RepID=A0ABP0FG16_CLALP